MLTRILCVRIVYSRSLLQLQVSSMALATRNGYGYRSCCISDRVLLMWLSCVPSNWHPIIGKVLGTTRERENEHDRYAVAVLEEETHCVVGHLPRRISRGCYFFLRTGGTITAEATGQRRHSNFPDGGLDIPIAVVRARHCHDFITFLNCAAQILIMH